VPDELEGNVCAWHVRWGGTCYVPGAFIPVLHAGWLHFKAYDPRTSCRWLSIPQHGEGHVVVQRHAAILLRVWHAAKGPARQAHQVNVLLASTGSAAELDLSCQAPATEHAAARPTRLKSAVALKPCAAGESMLISLRTRG